MQLQCQLTNGLKPADDTICKTVYSNNQFPSSSVHCRITDKINCMRYNKSKDMLGDTRYAVSLLTMLKIL